MSEKNSGRESHYMNALKIRLQKKKKRFQRMNSETKPVEGRKEEKPISMLVIFKCYWSCEDDSQGMTSYLFIGRDPPLGKV